MLSEGAQQDLWLYAYEDWPLQFTIYQDQNRTQVKDLTDGAVTLVIRNSICEVVRMDAAAEDLGSTGVVSFLISKESNENFSGSYPYELMVTDGDALTRKAASGTITIADTIIRG